MSENVELNIFEPAKGFWEVTVEIATEDEKGKIKKSKEVHLVDAECVTEAERKVNSSMEYTMGEYRIVSIKKSKTGLVY